MYFDRASMGNPARLLDTRQRTAKADKTYEILSGLARATIGVSQIIKQEHNAEMQRRAQNDLVNNTINPDMQRHERIYATTIAKGQALNAFRDLEGRISSGEFDDVDPLKFQETMNEMHAAKSEEYSSSKYRDDAVSTWNSFWVNQESTLTAGQAGKYRLALKGKQQAALTENIIGKYNTGKYSIKDMIDELSSPDYSMLKADDIADVALNAGATLAAQGDNTVLEAMNKQFDFVNDPSRYKVYDAATKVAHRVQRQVADDKVMQASAAFYKLVDSGELTPDMYNQEIIPGVRLSEAVDLEGNRIVTDRQFAKGIVQAQGNFVQNRQMDIAVKGMRDGVNLKGRVSSEVTDKGFNAIARDAFQNSTEQKATFHELGQVASAQSHDVTFFKNVGGTFADLPLMKGNDVHPGIIDAYQNLTALKQGYANDTKFYRALGTDGAARFKMIEYEAFYTPGSTETKILGAIEKMQQIDEAKKSGVRRNLTAIPDTVKEDISKEAKKYIKENDKFWRIDSVRDDGLRDFEQLVNQRFRDHYNQRNMSEGAAMEFAIQEVKGITEEFDGSLVITGGAGFDFGADNDYTLKTLQNDEDIAALVSSEYSSGIRYNLKKDPGLAAPSSPIKIPDYDKVRMIPNYETGNIMVLHPDNRILTQVPFEHVKILNEARKQYVWPVWGKIQDTFGKVWVTQEQYNQSITETDIEE